MSSFLNDIIANVPINPSTTSPTPLTLQLQEDSPANLEGDGSSSESEMSQHGDEDQEAPTQKSTQDRPDVTAFTINTARNLRLTAGGETSLLQFSQVPVFWSFLATLM
jgi:hypothetical protein